MLKGIRKLVIASQGQIIYFGWQQRAVDIRFLVTGRNSQQSFEPQPPRLEVIATQGHAVMLATTQANAMIIGLLNQSLCSIARALADIHALTDPIEQRTPAAYLKDYLEKIEQDPT